MARQRSDGEIYCVGGLVAFPGQRRYSIIDSFLIKSRIISPLKEDRPFHHIHTCPCSATVQRNDLEECQSSAQTIQTLRTFRKDELEHSGRWESILAFESCLLLLSLAKYITQITYSPFPRTRNYLRIQGLHYGWGWIIRLSWNYRALGQLYSACKCT
jgi:hypothetical protein